MGSIVGTSILAALLGAVVVAAGVSVVASLGLHDRPQR
jgi:hypothetical protein